MYYVYVIHNKSHGKYYVGQTQNLERRFKEHNSHSIKGYTARFEGEWMLIYSESFSTRSEAIKREKQLKSSRGRAYITQYIPGSNQDIPG